MKVEDGAILLVASRQIDRRRRYLTVVNGHFTKRSSLEMLWVNEEVMNASCWKLVTFAYHLSEVARLQSHHRAEHVRVGERVLCMVELLPVST